MNNLFNEKGDLSDIGKDTFEMYLDREIQILLNNAEDENELRIIGSLICKRVGDMVSVAAQKKREVQVKLDAMSDEEFDKYLDDKYASKYGPHWKFRSDPILSTEEIVRFKTGLDAKLKQAEEDAKALPRKPNYGLRLSPRQRTSFRGNLSAYFPHKPDYLKKI